MCNGGELSSVYIVNLLLIDTTHIQGPTEKCDVKYTQYVCFMSKH